MRVVTAPPCRTRESGYPAAGPRRAGEDWNPTGVVVGREYPVTVVASWMLAFASMTRNDDTVSASEWLP